MMKRQIIGLAAVVFALCYGQPGLACTDFKLTALDGSTLITRTLEFAIDFKSNIRTSTRGRQFSEFTPNGKPGMTWKAQYGYVFLDGMNVDVAVDGVNEMGLSFEYLYLPGETQYQTVAVGKEAQALPYIRLGDWVLSNFKSVDEVRAALANVTVFSQLIPGLGDTVFPLHAAIYDATGKGIVVEFVNGQMNIFDNQLGVMTNSPTYDWQVTNLSNYINLSPWTVNPIVIGDIAFASTGQGSGMKGLPGDMSPPSRFVKINALKATAYPVATAADALTLAQHIINNVDIPIGFVRAKNKDKVSVDSTEWTVFKDLTNKIFYYKTYGNTTLRAVMLSQLDFSSTAARLKMPITDSQFTLDMTKQFLNSRAVQ